MQQDEKKFIKRVDAASLTDLQPQTLANLAWQNKGPPYVRLSSRCIRYDRDELLAWMKAREIKPGE